MLDLISVGSVPILSRICKHLSLTYSHHPVLIYVFQFNAIVLSLMVLFYIWPLLYAVFIGIVLFQLLPCYANMSLNWAQLCLLFTILHAAFHDYFMEGMGVADNGFVDLHIHYAVFFCTYHMLDKHDKQFIDTSWGMQLTIVFNFINALTGIWLPIYMNYQSTGVWDWNFTHACTGINRLSTPEYIVFGAFGMISIIPVAVYFIACTIVLRCPGSITYRQAVVLSTLLFTLPNLAYFVVDPLWLVYFYNRVKYDQLYFLVPALFVQHINKPISTNITKKQL